MTDGQLTVSGKSDAVARAEEILRSLKITFEKPEANCWDVQIPGEGWVGVSSISELTKLSKRLLRTHAVLAV